MRRLVLGIVSFAAFAWAGLALAQAPALRCAASVVGARVLVEMDLENFFDPELLRLVRLGLEGELSIEVSLVKRRPLWFDAPVESKEQSLSVHFDRGSKRLLLDGRREVNDPERVSLERLALRAALRPDDAYRVEVSARLQVVTASSLGRLAGWISGRRGEEKRASGVPRNVLRALAEDLARVASARCEVRQPKVNAR